MFKYLLSAALLLGLTACSNDAQVASHNLSNAADNFQLNRRVVFYNGITGDYMLTIEGKCSLKADGADNQLEVTCKTGDNSYKKHFLGLSDNISYFSEQIDGANVSVYHYKVTFKPEVIVPDVDMKTSLK
ncbi:TPA: hypothetical protein PNO69_004510 [Salmonella enterica]|nr:hypothetical protein [Salmonella enterica]HCH9607953.1 hypothetical protein [Salmonella enterica]HDI5000247.1 hypothetical protein [Salmonella enterica]HDI5005068.1 hypothetical protein [Salmonella enterica]